ncbi:hypothetical protein ACIGO6_30350 [Streptomyces sp. NPDC053750]|uniref:hypothetical protein n=1 Tax=Streptomyces sp. NPDC053750 TaxID=3365714 RepID=UPI0037D0C45E
MTDKQHEQDLERVSGQNMFTDLTRHAEEHPSGGFLRGAIDSMVRSAAEGTPYARGVHGRTDFDNHRLNDMIDLVEQTNPEDLESSGKALWDARDAITEAAKELDGHIENVHWVGESGEAFRKWGRSLVTSTYGLSDFAGGAGDQITAAAVGLAAVRKAMPPRDTRPESQALKPDKLPTPKQVEGNAEYAEAVRVEKDRQEAINQMNRLSSYYAVANEQLIALEPPKFETMPDVGVPKPVLSTGDPIWTQGSGTSAAHRTSTATDMTSQQPTDTPAGQFEMRGSSDARLRTVDTALPPVEPDVEVGTAIDSVGTLPPLVSPTPGEIAPTAGVPGGNGGANNGFGSGYGTPVTNMGSSKGTARSSGLRGPVSTPGRARAADVAGGGSGRTGNGPVGPMGRTAATGQTVAKGLSSGAKSLPMGPGVTGGTARPTGASVARPRGGGVTGAGQANGVVGGRPMMGATPAKNGPKVPRGTVVGAEATGGSRPAERRPGQSGVFGGPAAGKSAPAPNRPRVGPGTPASITGSPAARNSASSAERNGMTRGGAGLVRGPGSRRKPERASDREETPRATHMTEDEETHLPTQQRRGVPPVVN